MQCRSARMQCGRNRPPPSLGHRFLQMEVPVLHPALPIRHFSEGALIELVRRAPPPSVDLESPARLVMTDLADMTAMTIGPRERLRRAEKRMVHQGLRGLFIVAQMPPGMGILTLAALEKALRPGL